MRHWNTGLVSSEDSLTKCGENASLALQDSPSSDFIIYYYSSYEEKMSWCPAASISWGKGAFLALVGHSSSDVVDTMNHHTPSFLLVWSKLN